MGVSHITWHHRLYGHDFEEALGVGGGQGSLACCSPWGHKESNMSEALNWLTVGSLCDRCFQTTKSKLGFAHQIHCSCHWDEKKGGFMKEISSETAIETCWVRMELAQAWCGGFSTNFWESLITWPTILNIEYNIVHWKDWCWSWNSNTLATWCEELTHLKSPWCWERSRAGGEGDDRGWDGWWHHWLDGHGFGWTLGVGEGQGGLVCCGSWGRQESDTTEWLNWIELNDIEWWASVWLLLEKYKG